MQLTSFLWKINDLENFHLSGKSYDNRQQPSGILMLKSLSYPSSPRLFIPKIKSIFVVVIFHQ